MIMLLSICYRRGSFIFFTSCTKPGACHLHTSPQKEDVEDSCSLLELKQSACESKSEKEDEHSKSLFHFIKNKKDGILVHDISITNRKVVPGIKLIKSARQLQECGIKFEKYKHSKSWLDISFDNEAIKIPPLSVEDHIETVFRNLIVLEEYYTSRSPKPSQTRRV